ncbi:hypothetical protein PFWH6_4079 [Pseudomonas fluorescens WH6]|nr:hypothetical protein PFWH6_4079 [Pseudomonas fluorescens WH6]
MGDSDTLSYRLVLLRRQYSDREEPERSLSLAAGKRAGMNTVNHQ